MTTPAILAGTSPITLSEPASAFHKTLEKTVAQGKQQAVTVSLELPTSYVVKQNISGVPQDVRCLTVAVYERAVENAIGRGLLGRGDLALPWTVVSALFAGVLMTT